MTEKLSSSHSTVVALDEVLVLGDDVVAGIGEARAEVLLHPDVRAVVAQQRVLSRLLLPMARDHFLHRQRAGGRDGGAIDQQIVAPALKSTSIDPPVTGSVT